MDCYVPNNPQFGVALEYLPGCGQHCGDLVNCSCHLDLGGRTSCCEDDLENCCQQTQDLNALSESILPDSPCLVNEDGTVNEPQWNEDMASFSLPNLELDPLPSLLSFSPCGYKNNGGDCRERGGGEAADVLLSLKHAVVHGDCASDVHPQVMVNNGYPYYEHYGSGPIFPTMSVNVSMNMTMHGCNPDQLCPQVWNQNTSPSVNVVYPQSQNGMSSTTYPSANFSFTADFRQPKQSDPLITASSFKPIHLQSPQRQPPFPFFQKQFSSKSSPPAKRSLRFQEDPRIDQNGFSIGHEGQMYQEYGYASCLNSPGQVQLGPLSGESEDDETKPNLCRICGKTYARPSTLKTHLRTHSGERPYRCGDCNKSFSQAANLTAHVRTHTGQKPFRCPICDRRFSQSSSVTTHMRTHSGERPYQCRSCKKAFSDSSTLTKHLRIHSGEKPYQCKLCLLRFSQSGNLNRHMRVHGNVPGSMID